ncbi:MarR family winged helix-turn-helix transcriptional regulator [Pseudonocardia sichuanensis]
MSKQSVVERTARAAAEFGDAGDAVDDAAAAVFGVNRTDLRLIGALRDGPLSAGRLAAAVQLSPAAATTAIQRLVARGHLTREPDPVDRRRAVVALTSQAMRIIEQVYGPLVEAARVTLARWSAAELGLIADFLERGRAMQLAEAERIRAMAGGAVSSRR